MNRVRNAFLDTSEVSLRLVRSPEIGARWDEPSALAQWAVRGLTGHLVRCTAIVESYLDADLEPKGETVSPAAYYAGALVSDDLDADEHKAIRQRGDEMAAAGLDSLRELHASSLERLQARLANEPPARNVKVFGDMVMQLDDYLTTRIVELTCHVDDLAISVDLPTPQMPLEATDISIRLLTAVARHRHGDLAVIRAMARRERDEQDALRVF